MPVTQDGNNHKIYNEEMEKKPESRTKAQNKMTRTDIKATMSKLKMRSSLGRNVKTLKTANSK